MSRSSRLGLWVGPSAFLLMLVVGPPETMPEAAWHVAGLAIWMAIWWSTEAVPVAATALLPLLVLPAMGLAPLAKAAAPYANPLIFLFLGGFLIALAVQRWDLHRRFALSIVLRVGTRPEALTAGFMVATGLISMWVSNTATAMLMLPIALSVLDELGDDEGRLAPALLLSVAYGASIGGLATLIGTPPNALLAAFAQETYGIRIGFAQWMIVGVPISAVLGVLAWIILTRVAFRLPRGTQVPTGQEALRGHVAELGRVGTAERRVAGVFMLAVVLWLLRPLLSGLPGLGWLDDTSVAIFAGLLLFLIPAGQDGVRALLSWSDTARLPWGTLLLFGGGAEPRRRDQRQWSRDLDRDDAAARRRLACAAARWLGDGRRGVPDGTDQQHGYSGGLSADHGGTGGRSERRSTYAHGTSGLGRQRRFHVAGSHSPQRDRPWQRACLHPTDGPGWLPA